MLISSIQDVYNSRLSTIEKRRKISIEFAETVENWEKEAAHGVNSLELYVYRLVYLPTIRALVNLSGFRMKRNMQFLDLPINILFNKKSDDENNFLEVTFLLDKYLSTVKDTGSNSEKTNNLINADTIETVKQILKEPKLD